MTGRQLTLLLLSTAAFSVIVFIVISGQYRLDMREAQTRYGEATAAQLAHHLVQYVVEKDLLSLNVVVNQMTDKAHVTSISVYDESNGLIAQAGRVAEDDAAYSSELSFQDSVVGFVRVGIKKTETGTVSTILILLGVFAAYAVVLWRYRDLVDGLKQLTEASPPEATPDIEQRVPAAPPIISIAEDAPIEHCLLVIRVRPAYRMEAQFERFYQAAKLYHGIVEQTTAEELVIHFEGADATYLGLCAGYLLREICNSTTGNIRFGGVVSVIEENVEKLRKAASYLASIADSELLLTSGESRLKGRVELQPFHHSLIDSDDLKKVITVETSTQLERQAQEIIRATALDLLARR